jgi:polyisoprenoid-binding protein YceI
MKRTLIAAALALVSTVAFAAPVTYKIDANHTDVVATWSHFGFSHPIANFLQVDGTLVYDAAKPADSKVEVTLPLAGLDAQVPDLTEHLRSADFFDAQQFPNATFKSTSVKAAGKGKLIVIGNLTIRGITKPVTLNVTFNKAGIHPLGQREAVGFDATATIKRTDFGLGKYAPNVSDEVKLTITTEAMVPKPE